MDCVFVFSHLHEEMRRVSSNLLRCVLHNECDIEDNESCLFLFCFMVKVFFSFSFFLAFTTLKEDKIFLLWSSSFISDVYRSQSRSIRYITMTFENNVLVTVCCIRVWLQDREVKYLTLTESTTLNFSLTSFA